MTTSTVLPLIPEASAVRVANELLFVGFTSNGVSAPPLLTDGRFSGGSKGVLIAHLEDMFKEGSITGLIENGDEIEIDMKNGNVNLLVNKEVLNMRSILSFIDEKRPHIVGTLGKFSRNVGGIEDGYMCYGSF